MQLKVAAQCNIGSSDRLDGQRFPDYSSASVNLAQSPSQTGWFWVEESRSGPPGMGRILPWNTHLFNGSERDSQDTAVHDYEGFHSVWVAHWTPWSSPVLKLYSFKRHKYSFVLLLSTYGQISGSAVRIPSVKYDKQLIIKVKDFYSNGYSMKCNIAGTLTQYLRFSSP